MKSIPLSEIRQAQVKFTKGEELGIPQGLIEKCLGRPIDDEPVYFRVFLAVNQATVLLLEPTLHRVKNSFKGWKSAPIARRYYISARSLISALDLPLKSLTSHGYPAQIQDKKIRVKICETTR